jgi:hypothetical protein
MGWVVVGNDNIDCILAICHSFGLRPPVAGPIRHETRIGGHGPGAGGLGVGLVWPRLKSRCRREINVGNDNIDCILSTTNCSEARPREERAGKERNNIGGYGPGAGGL